MTSGAYHNMSTPPRTRVPSHQLPVSGRVVIFCTELACLHHGLLTGPTRQLANAAARAAWAGDARKFLAALRRRRLQRGDAETLLAGWRGPVIGWTPRAPAATDLWPTVICTDLAWTLAVLGRVEGCLLLPARAARLTWERLFGEPFALDDARLAAVAGVARDRIGIATDSGATP